MRDYHINIFYSDEDEGTSLIFLTWKHARHSVTRRRTRFGK